jgi:hypothetical protein
MLYFVLLAKSLFLLEKLVGCGAEWGLPSNLLILLDFFRGWTSRHRECIGLRYLQSNANVPGILEFLDCPHSLIVLIVYDLLEQKSTKISSFFELFLVGVAYVCILSLRPSGAYLYYNTFWRRSQPKKELFFNYFLIILVAFWKEWKYNVYNN